MNQHYYWHRQSCVLLAHAPFIKGVKRNALIELEDGSKVVVPFRALRTRRPHDRPSHSDTGGNSYNNTGRHLEDLPNMIAAAEISTSIIPNTLMSFQHNGHHMLVYKSTCGEK